MTKKINIMYVIDQFRVSGGTETHLACLARSLSKEDYNVIIVVFDLDENHHLIESLRRNNVTIINLPLGRYYTLEAVKKGFWLSSLMKQHDIDIYQSFHYKADTFGALVAYLSGIRVIISSKRDSGDLKLHKHFLVHRFVNRVVGNYIFVAESTRRSVIKNERINNPNSKVIYNGVDTEKFSPSDERQKRIRRRELGFSPDDFIISMAAWLRPEKNHPMFFEALAKLVPRIKKIKGLIIGGGRGEISAEYQRHIELLGISAYVTFTGPVQDVRNYLSISDIACLVPNKNEGFSNAILEKMAMGLPLIVTDVGGNTEAVMPDYNGFVIPVNDSEALSRSIYALYSNQEMRKSMSYNSRKRAMDFFSQNKMIDDHKKFYGEALQRI
jgi:L-malate glycosyltransferase